MRIGLSRWECKECRIMRKTCECISLVRIECWYITITIYLFGVRIQINPKVDWESFTRIVIVAQRTQWFAIVSHANQYSINAVLVINGHRNGLLRQFDIREVLLEQYFPSVGRWQAIPEISLQILNSDTNCVQFRERIAERGFGDHWEYEDDKQVADSGFVPQFGDHWLLCVRSVDLHSHHELVFADRIQHKHWQVFAIVCWNISIIVAHCIRNALIIASIGAL